MHTIRFATALLAGTILNGGQRTLIDLDLTKGAPAAKEVSIHGGKLDGGWLVTGDLDRLWIDLGRDVRAGHVEVTVTRQGPESFEKRKRNWFGLSASPAMHQSPGGYARSGAEGYGFSKAEIFAASQPNTICEKKFGEPSDWVLDGKTPIVVRAEIKDQVMIWTNSRGGKAACGGPEQPVTHFRYVALGGILDQINGWHHGSLIGLKVLRVRVAVEE